MNKITYKQWAWPQNPQTWKQVNLREPQYEKTDDGETVFTGMSPVKRTVSGKGEFVGENAYADFLELIGIYNQSGAGELVHPVWGKLIVYFTELVLMQEPRSDYVAYEFEFREADANGAIPQ